MIGSPGADLLLALPTAQRFIERAHYFDVITSATGLKRSNIILALIGAVFLDGSFDCVKHVLEYVETHSPSLIAQKSVSVASRQDYISGR